MAKKKRLTADNIANPLQGSAFFPSTESRKTDRKTAKPAASKPVKRSVNRKNKGGRPKSPRPTTRHGFEIYVDQLADLRKLRAKQELETGKSVPLSTLVREALDLYLQSQNQSNPVYRSEN